MGALIITEDITGRKQLEQQLADSEKLFLLEKLVVGVTHQLGNSLFVISGYTQLLLGKIDEEDSNTQDLKAMEKEIEECKKTLKALLEYSRLAKYKGKPIDIKTLLEE